MATENVYKVKLVHPTIPSRRVVFDVTPDLVETRNINYKALEPIHLPGQIYVYGNTSSRTFNISNTRFVSRTQEEADKNLRNLQTLRSWGMPRFGQGSSTLTTLERAERGLVDPGSLTEQERQLQAQTADFPGDTFFTGDDLLGSPPDVLLLSAYSKTAIGSGTNNNNLQLEHIRRVPVVLQQLSIPYPSDVDYIPTTTGVPMPTVMTVDMVLLETQSPADFNRFSLQQYRNGVLEGF